MLGEDDRDRRQLRDLVASRLANGAALCLAEAVTAGATPGPVVDELIDALKRKQGTAPALVAELAPTLSARAWLVRSRRRRGRIGRGWQRGVARTPVEALLELCQAGLQPPVRLKQLIDSHEQGERRLPVAIEDRLCLGPLHTGRVRRVQESPCSATGTGDLNAYDLHATRSGFYGSSNYDWGKATRAEEGTKADPPATANDDYARYLRWHQLRAWYFGRIDATVGKRMEADTYDTYLKRICPDVRTICGEPENGWAGAPYSGSYDGGAYDGKVCSEDMVLDGLQVWARWGRPNGDTFSAVKFLAANRTWAADHGALAVFGLKTFAAQTPNPWVLLHD